ncbi:diacylglycerol kinase family protein [Pedobacter sp. MC2016-14]|uniref:diacylglycerol kinase family protein n=1 Tax=Pedobacter sp. MC2016-14 TaxID=2897327 RepID=UPI001E5332F4|nr:diacylglycerol kinase family protein [Pedobacter sp. MC2016-14]MCD0487751.1 diacylglycerol kinase family protein [Pedobacter sp. MC2016-14]
MRRLIKSFGYAFKGITWAFKTQPNFKFHCAAAALVLLAGYGLKLSSSEWIWIATAIGMVLSAELLNTAIEVLVDLVSPQYNIKAGQVKDLAAAAVLLVALIAATIGLIIFIPKLLPYVA